MRRARHARVSRVLAWHGAAGVRVRASGSWARVRASCRASCRASRLACVPARRPQALEIIFAVFAGEDGCLECNTFLDVLCRRDMMWAKEQVSGEGGRTMEGSHHQPHCRTVSHMMAHARAPRVRPACRRGASAKWR